MSKLYSSFEDDKCIGENKAGNVDGGGCNLLEWSRRPVEKVTFGV